MSESNLNTLSTHIEMKKVWQLLGIVAITAIVWNLPISVFDIDGLTVVQQRIIAIFVLQHYRGSPNVFQRGQHRCLL